jgi:glycosyltransferase involved in cell wall biosynthesis
VNKITFLLSQSLDSPSGLGRYGPLAKELTKLGHLVEIITLHPSFNDLESKEFEIDGVQLHYVAQMHVRKTGDNKSYFSNSQLLKITWSATWQLSRAAIASKSDIIYVGKPHPMNSLAGIIARIFNRSILIVDCDDYEAASGHFNSRWQKTIIAWFEKWMPHRAMFVTTNTHFMHDKLIGWGISKNKIVYLPNGIDKDRFFSPPPPELNSLREEMGLTGKRVVGFIGSLSVPSHPVDLLIEAFNILLNDEDQAILMLVGGGENLLSLKNLTSKLGISDFVKFFGRIPPERVPLYYSLADVSVDPVNDDDGARGRSPLKLFESWACGIPFVCGDVGDRRQLLGDPPAGVLARPGDPDSLAKAIHSIIINPEMAGELRQRGFERVNTFTWDKLANMLNKQFLDRLPISSP